MKGITLTTLLCLLAGQTATADTLDVPDEFQTIQGAISAAVDGDTVLVAPGTYLEQINPLGKAIEITSSGGADVTTIDGGGQSGPVVMISSGEDGQTIVSGFTITGGDDGGVRIMGSAPALRDLVITGNTATQGGGLRASHATLDAERLTIVDNGTVVPSGLNSETYLTIAGGGIFTANTGGRIVSSVIRGNAGAFGGAAYVRDSGTLSFINTLIAENRNATGALYANSSSPRIVNSTISGNDTYAIFTTFNARPEVENSILAGNGNPIFGTELAGNGEVSIRYSVLEGGIFTDVIVGDGVIDAPASLDADYRPLPGSPAIDAGDNTLVPDGVTTDLAGGPRFVDDPGTPDTGVGQAPIVDLGAFEFAPEPECPGDMNGDGITDLDDVNLFVFAFQAGDPMADLNADDVHDLADVMVFAQAMNDGCDAS